MKRLSTQRSSESPDSEWGQNVKAFVELAPAIVATDDVAEELISHVGTRLAAFKNPGASSSESTSPEPRRASCFGASYATISVWGPIAITASLDWYFPQGH